jgi:hypothetical protein
VKPASTGGLSRPSRRSSRLGPDTLSMLSIVAMMLSSAKSATTRPQQGRPGATATPG